MDDNTIFQAIEFAKKCCGTYPGIVFFGGEPLLRKDLIEKGIYYALDQRKIDNFIPHFKVSTNGLLIDTAFLDFARDAGLAIALSIDGIEQAHNQHRRLRNDASTFEIVINKLKLLLEYQPYANVLMTVTPETVHYYHDSVEFLIDLGVRYLIVSLNYAGSWDIKSLAELRRQYKKLSSLYERLTVSGKKFYFSPFETKLESHIKGKESKCQKCAFSERQLSIAPDGKIYPCIQFVRDGVSNISYSIGNIWDGIDPFAKEKLLSESKNIPLECAKCSFLERCNNDCNCLNWQTTGTLNGVSPLLCETERMIIPIVDRLGERLYKKRSPLFIQKHYNRLFPYLSLLEEELNQPEYESELE